jgi:hypothetical protein
MQVVPPFRLVTRPLPAQPTPAAVTAPLAAPGLTSFLAEVSTSVEASTDGKTAAQTLCQCSHAGRSPRHFNRRLACSLTPSTNSSGAIVAFMSTRYSSSSITSRTVHSRPSRSSSNAIGCSRRCLAGSVCSTYCGNQAVSRAFRRSFMPFPPFSNRAVLLQPFLDSLHGSHASISTCISDIFSTFKSRSR